MEWTQLYGSRDKPRLAEIREYMEPQAFALFEAFNRALAERYNLAYVRPRYTKNMGWVYDYGRSGYILVRGLCFFKNGFAVEGTRVSVSSDLPDAIAKVDGLFHDGFLLRYADYCQERIRRTKERKAARQAEPEGEYKRSCKWCPKVSRTDLTRLYRSHAEGILDEALLEDIGITLYIRCKTAKEIYDLMEKKRIKCMHCGEILAGAGVLSCSCGKQYTYHAYRKSFREDNMPRGAASPVFDRFVADWEKASSVKRKMELVDGLIHAFHVAEISGSRGRPVGVNLIQGTKPQIIKLLCALAGKEAL